MTAQEVIKEILSHIDSLEINEAMDAVRCDTGGDAGYAKALNDMRDFIRKRFRDDTEKVEPAGEVPTVELDMPTIAEYIRNLGKNAK